MGTLIILIRSLDSKLNGLFIIFEKRRGKKERREQVFLIVLFCCLGAKLKGLFIIFEKRKRKKRNKGGENLSILIILIGSLGPKLNGLFIIFLDSLSVKHDTFVYDVTRLICGLRYGSFIFDMTHSCGACNVTHSYTV